MSNRLAKAMVKDNMLVDAWLNAKPIKLTSRDKQPKVPVLSTADVLNKYTPVNPAWNAQYFTPLEMAEEVFQEVEDTSSYIPADAGVLDPCAGIGNLLYPFYQRPQWDHVTGVEVDADCARLGRQLFCDSKINFYAADAFDFCPIDSPSRTIASIPWDVVVMNPPFNTRFATDSAVAWCQSGATKSEHYFLELAVRVTRPRTGKIFVVAPYNYYEGIKGKAKAWFDERIMQVSRKPLNGKFKQTGIRVELFTFWRR